MLIVTMEIFSEISKIKLFPEGNKNKYIAGNISNNETIGTSTFN